MRHHVIIAGKPADDTHADLLAGASPAGDADILVHLAGSDAAPDPARTAILIELGTESLAAHVDESEDTRNVLGFARYRNGRDAASSLVELVHQKHTSDEAIAAARALFENIGLQVVVCDDQAGRIIDRLVRPKYNAALRFLDEGLATQEDIDLTCRLGLGYADGPIERVVRGGLDLHHDITRALFETYGQPGYAPARRSIAAKQRLRGQ